MKKLVVLGDKIWSVDFNYTQINLNVLTYPTVYGVRHVMPSVGDK